MRTALLRICATAFFQLLLLLMCVASEFTFEATNVLFFPQTIMTAGSYSISCSDPSERLIVIGCSPPVNNSFPGGAASPTDPGVVSIQVLRSPSQLTVSDSSVYTYLNNSKSTLAGCSIHITYLAPVPSAVNLSGNVLVALKTSLAELRILLHSRLTLGGSFVWIQGLDDPNASIGLVSVVAGPKSSFVCGGSHSSAPRCSVSLGASFVRFSKSPPITKLLVVLNGTDVTMATWRWPFNISSFALVLIDNVTITSRWSYPVPDSHSIILVDVIGAIAGSRLLALLNPYQQYDRVSVSYPQFAGDISARNCSFVGEDDFVAIFDFSDLKRTTIALESVSVLSFLLNVVRVNTLSFDISEITAVPRSLTISRSYLASASSLITFGIVDTPNYRDVWNTVVIRHSNITIPALRELLSIEIDGSAVSLVAPPLGSHLVHLAMNFTLHRCVVSLASNTASLLAVLGPEGSATQAPFPIISNSTVRFEGVVIEQLWQAKLYMGYVFPAVSVIHLKNVSNTTIAFIACDVSVRQVSPASAVLRTALLLEIHGMFLHSSIVFERSSFAVDTRGNFTAPSALQMPIIAFSSDVISTTIGIVASNFTNIPIITSGAQLANLHRSTSAVFMVGCHNRWCPKQQPSSSNCMGLSIDNVYNKTEFVGSSAVVTHCTSTSYTFTQPKSNTSMVTLTPSVSHSLEFVLATPVPILSRTLAAAPAATQIFTVAIAAPLASAVLATSVAGVIQRSTVVLQFSTCTLDGDETRVYALPPRGQQLAINENPTRLSFGYATGSMYRGGAVGNSALLVGVCVAVIPAVALYHRFSQSNDDSPKSISCSLARLRLPSRVFVVLSVLLQPTATACAGLLFLALSAGDVVLAVAAALLWFCVILWFVWAVQHGCSKLVVACMKPPRDDGAFDFILERPNDWVPQPHLTDATAPSTKLKWIMDASEKGAKHFALQFSVLIAPVGKGTYRQQYYCFGCLWSVITGVVGALDPSAASSCQLAQVTLVAVAALSLVSLVAIRPYTSKFDQGFQILLELLSLIAAVLILTGAGASGGAMSISYAQIGISFIVSLLRGANRVLLWCTDLQWTNHSVDKKKKVRQLNPTCSVVQHLNLSYSSAGESVVAGSFTHNSIRNSSFHPPCDHDYTSALQRRVHREMEQRRDQLKYLIEFITSTR
ncbi:membrane-associated protein, putative [Bodo saltans]|uniref:Membrane-associated protein, putative n=1 Tax=Bodo saltans TaxID=75058 RepID=A0A0S4KLY9_BODSA|nr:membrane-associated protein, putative [Bodo saltans]|eukprot:CUI14609.1 membrane-associated protein, putative [Bodo saltans]